MYLHRMQASVTTYVMQSAPRRLATVIKTLGGRDQAVSPLFFDDLIKGSGFRRGTPAYPQPTHFQRYHLAGCRKRHDIADADRCACFLDPVTVQSNMTRDRSFLCNRAGFAKARVPEP